MAQRLELYWQDISGAETIVNLLNGVFQLADNGWESESSDEPLWETFVLFAEGTDAQIRQEQDNLDTLIENARRYLDDPSEKNPVLLRVQSEGEAIKQSVVADGRYKYHTDSNMGPLLGENTQEFTTAQLVTLAILRAPVFEPPITEHTLAGVNDISDLGGTWVIGNPAGIRPQRIARADIFDYTNPAAERNKVWVGIRRVRYGTAGFSPLWEAENGEIVTGYDATVVAAVGTASADSKLNISFTNHAELSERIIYRGRFMAPGDDNIGSYLVLGRLKLDAGTTEVHLQLRQGYMAYRTLNEITGDVYLSAVQDSTLTSYQLVELGTFTIPGTGNRQGEATDLSAIEDYGFSLYAERISAGGNIDIDAYILIPTDHYAILTEAKIGYQVGAASILTSPLNEQYAIGNAYDPAPVSRDAFHSINFTLGNWGYPAEGGVLVIAGQATASHVLGNTFNIQLILAPRWRMYRV